MPGLAYGIGVLLALASATVTQGCDGCHSSCSDTADGPVTLQGDEWMAPRVPGDLPSVAEGCQATDAHDEFIQELLQRMEDSVKFDEPPNPSILLAMNLVGATHSHVHNWLLHQIKKDAVERAQTGGEGRGREPRAGEGVHLIPADPVLQARHGQLSGWHIPSHPTTLSSCPHRHDLGRSGSVHPRPPLLLQGPPVYPCHAQDHQPDPHPEAENE